MKEIPILFSGEMVRAILDGRKSVTRRVVRPHPFHGVVRDGILDDEGKVYRCPYGQPGDRLWVRETFYPMPHLNAKAYFRCTDLLVGVSRWVPSIFMPRWASRITLEVTGVRVERVWDITEASAKAEGVEQEIDGWNKDGVVKVYWKSFATLWDALNAKRGFGWDKNPWVWVVEFKRISQ